MSYDASWMTRGHKSVYGIGCVVDLMTNLIIDFAVLNTSWLCNQETTWTRRHTNMICDSLITHVTKTLKAQLVRWMLLLQRFSGNNRLPDTAFGMSPSIRMAMLNVYSDACPIQKEECVNHVSKRLGTALHKVVGEGHKEGVVTSGKGFGKLTAVTIDKLTRYYRLAT